jgi:hypothetical protein
MKMHSDVPGRLLQGRKRIPFCDPDGRRGLFVAYFLVYALRKAFTASTFGVGVYLWGLDYKVVDSRLPAVKILRPQNRFGAETFAPSSAGYSRITCKSMRL